MFLFLKLFSSHRFKLLLGNGFWLCSKEKLGKLAGLKKSHEALAKCIRIAFVDCLKKTVSRVAIKTNELSHRTKYLKPLI